MIYSLRDSRYIQYIDQGLSPIEVKMMLSILDNPQLIDKNKQKYLNLMAMAISVIRHEGNLRKMKK